MLLVNNSVAKLTEEHNRRKMMELINQDRESNKLYQWAAMYFVRKKYKEAEEYLEKFFADSDWQSNVFACNALFMRGAIAEEMGHFPLAYDYFRQANDHYPSNKYVAALKRMEGLRKILGE